MTIDPFKQLNQVIGSCDNRLFPSPETSTNCFVIGCPRSGTTILTQVLCHLLDVGYINNLAAAFWESPALGVMISRQLLSQKVFSGKSDFGATNGLSEPHEFGGFWRSQLGYADMVQKSNHVVDWASTLHRLDQIGTAWNKSVLYKVFQLVWHLTEFHSLRPRTKWIWVKRDRIENAASLMKLYEKRGVKNGWVSAVPQKAMAFADRSVLEKCVAQIYFTEDWIDHSLKEIPEGQVMQIHLHDLIANPLISICQTAEFLGMDLQSSEMESVLRCIQPSKPIGELLRVEIADAFDRLVHSERST